MSKPASGYMSTGVVSGITATAIVIADMVGVGVFTSLGFQITDIKSGFSLLLLWLVRGGGGDRGGILLRAIGHHVAAIERGVQLSAPDLSSGVRVCGRLVVGDGRLCSAHCARRHGIWQLFQIHRAAGAAAVARGRHNLARRAGASGRRKVWRRVP